MSWPDISCSIAFTTAPAATPVWEDVTDYLKAFSYTRGRSHELDQMQPGTLTVELDNRDRRFEPAYASGDYYPDVLPMKRIRLQATWDSITYDLYHGFIDEWPLIYAGPQDAWVTLPATDGFKVFGLARLNTTYAQQRSDIRIGAVLDSIGWPAADRSLATGQSDIQAVTLENEPALSHIQAVEQAENGRFFVSRAGFAIFHDRHQGIKQPITNHITLGEQETPYVDALPVFDEAHLWNDVRYQREGGEVQVAADSASQTAYYIRTAGRTGLLNVIDAEVMAAAEHHLYRYKEPRLYIRDLVLDAQVDPDTLWPHLLARDIGARVTVRKRPPGGGTYWEQVSTIEGITAGWTADGNHWTGFSWSLSPADTQEYWQLGTTGMGELNTATRLAY